MSDLVASNQMSVEDALEGDSNATLTLTDEASDRQIRGLDPLTQLVKDRYEIAKLAKRPHEERAIRAYMNFRGLKNSETSFSQTEISKAFIKISKTKTIAAYGQLIEVVFVEGKLPIEICATPEPEGIPEYVHIDPKDPMGDPEGEQGGPQQGPQQMTPLGAPRSPEEIEQSILGFPGDGRDLKPGETISSRLLQGIRNKFMGAIKLKNGPGDGPDRILYKPAEIAATLANKRIHDQLAEMRAVTTVRQSALELVMLGTGIIEGPFNVRKEFPDWDENGNYVPVIKEVPVYKHVSFWDFFPDPEARKQEELGWVVVRAKVNKTTLREWKKNESFLPQQIDMAIEYGPDYVKEDYENTLDETNQEVLTDRFEVLKFWGTVDKAMVEDLNVDLGFDWPEDTDEMDVNVWVCNDTIIRFVLNPFRPSRLPYFIAQWEFNPYSVFGIGVPENMEDTQMLMNGFMRLAVDNAVLSGTIMLEVDESLLSPGQEFKIESSKIWRRNVPGAQPAIRPVQINNVSQANIQMFETARRLADESTGIPSFSHGMTGVQGIGRTAGGISMLLNAASLNTKTAVKNLDDYWFQPMGESLYQWNLQHQYDAKIKGDISIIAKGTANLAQKSTKLQNMLQGAQVVAGIPPAAAWVNWKEWTKEFFKLLEIDTNVALNRPDEYQMQMALMMAMQQKAQSQQGPMQPGQENPALPGQQGFTGTPQEQGGMTNDNSEQNAGPPNSVGFG